MRKLTFATIILLFIGCASTDSIKERTREYLETAATRKTSEMSPDIQELQWTVFDSLAQVAETVSPDTAFAMLVEFYGKKSEKSRLSTELAVRQYLDVNRLALMSCLDSAIYISTGDNDFYPALYLQKVEEVRTDVLIVNNSIAELKKYREYLTDDPRIRKLFTDEEWLAGPDSTEKVYDWIAVRKNKLENDGPNLNIATVCDRHFKATEYYRRGITWAVEAPDDSSAIARKNMELFLACTTSSLTEEWEPEMEHGWITCNIENGPYYIVEELLHADSLLIEGFLKKTQPILRTRLDWQAFLIVFASKGYISKEYALEKTAEYFATHDRAEGDTLQYSKIEKMREKLMEQ